MSCIGLSDVVEDSSVREHNSFTFETIDSDKAWRFLLLVIQSSVRFVVCTLCTVIEI